MNTVKAQIRHVTGSDGAAYDAVAYWCPAPKPGYTIERPGEEPVVFRPHDCGLHMLPIRGTGESGRPSWDLVSLDPLHVEPSVLTPGGGTENDPRPVYVCHCFVRNGQIEFLGDCTHVLAGRTVDLPDLPDWITKEALK